MKSTEDLNPQINVSYTERTNQERLLALLKQKRLQLKRMSRQWWRSKLKRINAKIEIYRIDLEIDSKRRYLAAIDANIEAIKG